MDLRGGTSDFLARLGLKARVLAWLLVASGLRYSKPGPGFVALFGFGFSWPASPGFICLWPDQLTSHGLYVKTSLSGEIWPYIRKVTTLFQCLYHCHQHQLHHHHYQRLPPKISYQRHLQHQLYLDSRVAHPCRRVPALLQQYLPHPEP